MRPVTPCMMIPMRFSVTTMLYVYERTAWPGMRCAAAQCPRSFVACRA